MRKRWTDDEVQLLRREYPDTPTTDLSARLGHSMASIYGQVEFLGLRKSPEYMQGPHACRLRRGDNVGKATRFKPGHRPHNYKEKGWSAGGNSVKTQFKPGRRPPNWVPVGSERLVKGRTVQRKISDTGCPPRDWKSVHSILWESHHGPVPAGHIVVFREGSDVCIENLELISRAENMRRNSIHNWPPELVEVARIRGVLTRRINERIKRNGK